MRVGSHLAAAVLAACVGVATAGAEESKAPVATPGTPVPVAEATGPPVAVATTPPLANGPHGSLKLDTLEHEFGAVKAGTPLSFTFKFKNKGKAPLEITEVKPSCGCTKGDFDKLVEPGKEGKITLSIAKTDTYSGPLVKTATVKTNDPEHESLVLTLRANFTKE